MNRNARAMLLGLLLTLGLGFIAKHGFSLRHADDQASSSLTIPPVASLSMMIDETAHQPFVRRQFVPFILRIIDDLTPLSWRIAADHELTSSLLLQPFLFASGPLGGWHSAFCLMVWFCSFTVFAYVLESEARHYASEQRPIREDPSAHANRAAIIFAVIACLVVLPLLHNNYIYDPPTLVFSTLALSSIRRERLGDLIIITALFSFNRETAFIVPGMTFFYWIHRHRLRRAFFQAAILSVIYFVIAGMLIYSFRGNAGAVAESNVRYLVHMYLHEKLYYLIGAAIALGAYAVAVINFWKVLPPALKSVQWFIFPWIVMHILWGWPMEWRVFFEIYPGILLTLFTLRSVAGNRIASVARRVMPENITRKPLGLRQRTTVGEALTGYCAAWGAVRRSGTPHGQKPHAYHRHTLSETGALQR